MRGGLHLYTQVNEGLARVEDTEFDYGPQLWTRAKARKAKPCRRCSQVISPGSFSWSPITHGYNRMHRICQPCIDALARARASDTSHRTEAPDFDD